ncbi:hypothetical protein ACFQZE_07065 [Paenibacillus sp. GCM10027627]|uniref:hypothetical protein n=1 Tax=unclassified Paenibacillus TaxID=185978 RepID=UPI00363839D3
MYAYLTFVGYGNNDVKLVTERNDELHMTRKTELYEVAENKIEKLTSLKKEGKSLIPFLRTECKRIK